MTKVSLIVAWLASLAVVDAFSVLPSSRVGPAMPPTFANRNVAMVLAMSTEESTGESSASSTATDDVDPMEDAMMDAETRLQMEKIRRSDELRAQEVFMKKSTGKYKCSNCDWEYDPEVGDSNMIGGTVKPGTQFEDLASNWRCPVCRASKDSFAEVVTEIPGFEVNQGYGFGGNAMTSEQKNTIIFGGLGLMFILLIGGYGLS